jgi:hypothetical protein
MAIAPPCQRFHTTITGTRFPSFGKKTMVPANLEKRTMHV